MTKENTIKRFEFLGDEYRLTYHPNPNLIELEEKIKIKRFMRKDKFMFSRIFFGHINIIEETIEFFNKESNNLKIKEMAAIHIRENHPKDKALEIGNLFYEGSVFEHGKEAHLIELEKARSRGMLHIDGIIAAVGETSNEGFWHKTKKELKNL